MKREMQLIDLAILIGLPPSGPAHISEHVNRLRHRPDIERRLAGFFCLSRRQLRSRLWPSPSRARTRARAFIKQESNQ